MGQEEGRKTAGLLLELANKLVDVAEMASRALQANATLAARVAELEAWKEHRFARKAVRAENAAAGPMGIFLPHGLRDCACPLCDWVRAFGSACKLCERVGCPNGKPEPQEQEVQL